MIEKTVGNRYAVVDLEATGTGRDAKIIQIGIVIVQDGQIVQTYESDVNPHEELTPHIQLLTGISNKQVRKAPDFGQLAEEIYHLLEDTIFVAHNVKFDGNLLVENLFFEGFDLHRPWVDTVELAQLFFPSLEKYSLVQLSEELNLNLEQAHTAISDAMATAQLLLKIQEKIASLPKRTVEQVLELADYLIFESRLVIDEVYAGMSDVSLSAYQEVQGLMLKKEKESFEMRPLSQDFSENLRQLGLEQREPQRRFAERIKMRLKDDKQVHFIQAQAGIGKTYGYLLPLLAESEQPLLLAVPTRALQQQIMEKEGKNLADTFNVPIQSLKSPKHFIKLEHFWKSLQREDSNRLINRYKMHILVWLCETETGDMDELKQKLGYPSYFEELQHDGFLSPQSLFAELDFWRRLQSKARTSRVLLTNHAYLLHHLKDQAYLMDNRLLVVDEAQKLLLTAEEFTSQKISLSPIVQKLQSGKDSARHLLEQRIYESSLFELQQWLRHYQQEGKMELEHSSLQQLRQNLEELDPLEPDLSELKWLLDFYDHFWIEEEIKNGQADYGLRASQMDLLHVATMLPQTKLFCVSATLTISKRVTLADLLGFQDITVDELPHQKSDQQALYYLSVLPDLVELPTTEQAHLVADVLQDLLDVEQPIFVLFTSRILLSAVSSVLEEREQPHLSQYRDGDELVVKKRFERGECPILLATGAFWEGIDFANQDYMIQVIPRLPFDNPQDPLVKKINHSLRKEGKQPFYDFNLPVMLLKLKQAIGRTKRNDQQVSAVVMLDKRIQNKRYSRYIKHFLNDEYHLQSTTAKDLPQSVRVFFKIERKKK